MLIQQQVRWTTCTYEDDDTARAPPVFRLSWRACGGGSNENITLSLLARSHKDCMRDKQSQGPSEETCWASDSIMHQPSKIFDKPRPSLFEASSQPPRGWQTTIRCKLTRRCYGDVPEVAGIVVNKSEGDHVVRSINRR